MQKQTALEKITSLVERFEEQKEFYKRADYNETQTRRDFIDPFWKALGWDVDNENGYAESYREVIHEDRVKVGGATKAPDYSFRLVGGKRLFFLEAKKPSVDIKSDVQPAYQVRRYGWSAKMPISIITDFEEFAIYDCNTKPKPTDKASNGRIKYIIYQEYIAEFDFIWDTFAKERVLKGSFDKYITSDKNKKGTSTVDNEFLITLDKWRKELAMNIALRNKDISEDELNFVVQHTIDRILFLRIAEDRSIEPYGDLQDATQSGIFYQNLFQLFHFADQKYNSGLFDFEKDKISEKVSIDNKVIKNIISELYYPVCPYEFSVLSVEILGSAYEQFLGKQISLTAGGRARIEEKPQVRKAGGVYYTPQYIVDYIVKNTVGKLLGGWELGIGNRELGNELNQNIGLDYETESKDLQGCERVGVGTRNASDFNSETGFNKQSGYASNLEKTSNSKQTFERNDSLNKQEQSQFLIPNSRPLTPDEVSKIKICDPACGSGSFLLGAYQFLLDWHKDFYTQYGKQSKGSKDNPLTPLGELTTNEKKRILLNNIYGVDLDSNAVEVSKLSLLLKCMEGETKETIETQTKLFRDRVLPDLDNNIKSGNSLIDLDFYDNEIDFDEERKVKPFSWERAFPEVFGSRESGVRNREAGFDVVIGNPPYVNVENLSDETRHYLFEKYKTCKGRTDIYIAFIEKCNSLLKKNGTISMIIPYAFTNQKYGEEARKMLINNYFINEIVDTSNYYIFDQANVKNIILSYQNRKASFKTNIKIIKSENNFIKDVFELIEVSQSDFLKQKDSRLDTNLNEKSSFLKETILNQTIPLSDICLVAYGARLNHRTKKIGKKHYISNEYQTGNKPFLEGKNIERYYFSQFGWLNYKPDEHYNSMFPELFENEKLMFINVVSDRIRFAYDNNNFYNSHTVVNCVRLDKLETANHITAKKAATNYNVELSKKYDYFYLLGILNSNLINWYFKSFLSEGLHFFPNDAKQLPIKIIEEGNEKNANEIIKLVDQLLQLNKDKQNISLPNQLEIIENRIDYTERKIDQIVYQLYDLTEEEIKIVEGELL